MDEDTQSQETETPEEALTEEVQAPSDDDLKAEVAKYKAIAERKSKQLEKVQSSLTEEKDDKPKKPKTEQGVPTLEHVAILSQDPNVEKLQFAEKLAKVEGTTLTEAYNSEVAQAKFAAIEKDAQIKASSLPPSGGSAPAQREKTPANMTDSEHEAWGKAKLQGATHK